MKIALAVSERAVCMGLRVGAVLVRDERIIATGYNGTPEHMPNCDDVEKGCYRCANREHFVSGTGYDLCICVHAEQNALLSAARFGTAVEGAVIYTTHRPCFGCAKEALQARIDAIYYLNPWDHPSTDQQIHNEYNRILGRFPKGVRQVRLKDAGRHPDPGREVLTGTGHGAIAEGPVPDLTTRLRAKQTPKQP
jgi:dCMP deaminase